LNLVVNAVQAMSAVADRVREVLVTTAQAGPNGVLVGVADFGSGFDPASIGRIFDPFYSTKSGALEMGLSVCRSIVATLGGRLSVKPNIPRGAVFEFPVPAAMPR
jgi:signal transduction histidine kinase